MIDERTHWGRDQNRYKLMEGLSPLGPDIRLVAVWSAGRRAEDKTMRLELITFGLFFLSGGTTCAWEPPH